MGQKERGNPSFFLIFSMWYNVCIPWYNAVEGGLCAGFRFHLRMCARKGGIMGIYVNPGNIAFKMSRFSEIYVDKSMLVAKMNAVCQTERRFACVSRPRRFGKSMAANMLSAYYSRGCDSASLFAGLRIEKDAAFLAHLNRHNVIRLDIQQFLESRYDLDTFIRDIEETVIEELAEAFPGCGGIEAKGRLKTALNKIFYHTGQGFLFIIDEWDCVFRVAKERRDIQKDYLDFLRGLFKGQDYVELAYMTGILPIKKYGEHSALNIFDEYSMVGTKGLGEFFGFTEEEVAEGCARYGMDYAEMERWYDGYLIGGSHIYNPKSVADALTWKQCRSYWTGTETYEALKAYINLDFDGLKGAVVGMLGGLRCQINPFTYQNDMTTFATRDDVLTILVHLGYLAYDESAEEVFIPNLEIAQEFLNAADGSGWRGLTDALNRSEALLRGTWALDGDAVAMGMEAIHAETASMLKYHDENSLTCTVLMAYYSARAYLLPAR